MAEETQNNQGTQSTQGTQGPDDSIKVADNAGAPTPNQPAGNAPNQPAGNAPNQPAGNGPNQPAGNAPKLNQPAGGASKGAGTSASPDLQNHPLVQKAGLLARVAETLAGGPRYQVTTDPISGEIKRQQVPLSKGSIALALATEFLGGSGAGLAAGRGHGAGAAAMAGFQQGEKQGQQRTAQEDADFARQAQIANTNMQMASNHLALANADRDLHQKNVDSYNSLYALAQKANAVDQVVSEDELHKMLQSGDVHVTKNMAIPVRVVPALDANGTQEKDEHGNLRYEYMYALVKPDTKLTLPDDVRKILVDNKVQGYVDSDGKEIPLPNDLEQRMSMIVSGLEKANTIRWAQSAFDGFARGQMNPVHKDTVPGNPGAGPQIKDEKIASAVDDAARKYGIRPELLRSLVVEESGGNPKAKSSAGAMGLGQLMPATAKRYGVNDPLDPNQNLDGAAHYLSDLIKSKGGSEEKALAAYHGIGFDGNTTDQEYVKSIMGRISPAQAGEGGEAEFKPQMSVTDALQKHLLTDTDLKVMQQLGGVSSFLNGNPKTGELSSAQKAAEAGKVPSDSIGRITEFMGGQDAIDTFREKRLQYYDQLAEKNKLDFEAQKKTNEEKEIIARNNDLIDAMIHGQQFDVTKIATMRAYDRETIVNEAIKRSRSQGIQWNPEDVKSRIDLYHDAAASNRGTVGTFANSIQNAKTSLGHMGGAMDALNRLKKTYPDFDAKFAHKTLSALNDQFGSDPDWVRFQVNLHTAATDWQNLLNNQHALTDPDKKTAERVANPNATFNNVVAALQEMAHTAAVRIVPLNDRWRDVMGKDYPDLLNGEAVQAIKSINNPDVTRLLGEMQVGGNLRGSADGSGTPGRTVNEMLGNKPPQQPKFTWVTRDGKLGYDGQQWVDVVTGQPVQPPRPAGQE